MDPKKKLRHENNNTSLPVQQEWHHKLINEVNYKYRLFTDATLNTINNEEERNTARIVIIEKISKFDGLEQHHFGEQSTGMHHTNHPSGKLRCRFLHRKDKISKNCSKSLNFNGYNNMPAKKDTQRWNIVHIPTSQVLLCDECGIKLGSKTALNRHRIHQHASFKLIYPKCNYLTTRKDNMRGHLINTIIDNLQHVQTEQKNAKLRCKPPPAPKRNTDELKEIRKKDTNCYVYTETLPKNKKIYPRTLEYTVPPTTKKFTTKPVTIPPKRNTTIIPPPVKQVQKFTLMTNLQTWAGYLKPYTQTINRRNKINR